LTVLRPARRDGPDREVVGQLGPRQIGDLIAALRRQREHPNNRIETAGLGRHLPDRAQFDICQSSLSLQGMANAVGATGSPPPGQVRLKIARQRGLALGAVKIMAPHARR
jgi:hypothetical protein